MSVEIECQWCQKRFAVKASRVGKQKFCSLPCTREYFKVRFAGTNNPAFGKTYRTKETHPEWAEQIAKTQRESGAMLGTNNPMCRPDVAKRMSITRRQQVTSDPQYRKRSSERMRKAWADGKYAGVKTGKCKWYDHVRPNGSIVKLQGTWEVVLAKHLDSLDIDYDAHVGRIKYVDHAGVERSYYPDFYVPVLDCYLDVKGAYFDSIQASKFEYIKASNPKLNILIVNRDVFSEWGINVQQQSKEFS